MGKKRRTKKQKIAARKRQSREVKLGPGLEPKQKPKPVMEAVDNKDNTRKTEEDKLGKTAEDMVKDWRRTIWVSGVVLAGLAVSWWWLSG